MSWLKKKRVEVWSLGAIVAFSAVACSDAAMDPTPVAQAQTPEDEGQSDLEFYRSHSMLAQAERYAGAVVGDPAQWSGPYEDPQPKELKSRASVWLTIYPRAIISEEGKSVLGTLGDPRLWDELSDIGFELMHPVAFERAGQLREREFLPSIDGGFDRISMEIDPVLGSEEDVRGLVQAARDRKALVAGDVIPLHTGRGADFRLAQMGVDDYPGIYDMIEIPEADWGLLPDVSDEWSYTVITKEGARPLYEKGYIPGTFDVLLADPDAVDWSGWAATAPVTGADGKVRRWVYGHLFKPEQPMLNWMDPTYAGRRVQAGDVVRHVNDLGLMVNRLDAVPFLGLDPMKDSNEARTYGTPLSIAGTNDLAYTHRKLGGWSWVELNVPIDQYKDFMANGSDLGYDFFTRAQTVHPLITGNAQVYRIAHRLLRDKDVPHSGLIHALQNHDEITYQLINLGSQDEVKVGDETKSGKDLAEEVRSQMRKAVAGDAAPYNKLYRPAEDGVATTYAGFIAPALGIDPYSASPDEIARIKQAHVLVAMATAMQPGVFAISQWDLVGALPIPEDSVADRTAKGDVRWVNRGAVDLLGANPGATESAVGLMKAKTLYGSLTDQLDDPESFVSQIKRIVAARKEYGLAEAEVVDVPDVSSDGVAVLVMKLPDSRTAVTVLNYGREQTTVKVALPDGVSGGARDIVSDGDAGTVFGGELSVDVGGLSGRTLVLGEASSKSSGSGSGGGPGSGGGS